VTVGHSDSLEQVRRTVAWRGAVWYSVSQADTETVSDRSLHHAGPGDAQNCV